MRRTQPPLVRRLLLLSLWLAATCALTACGDGSGSGNRDTTDAADADPDALSDMDIVDVLDTMADADVSDMGGEMGGDVGNDAVIPPLGCAIESGLPVVNAHDATAAARGEAWFTGAPAGRGILPRLGLQNLWLVWGGGIVSGDVYWTAFRERYGFHEAPFANDGLPMGIRDAGSGMLTFDCLMCHGGTVAGQPVIGAANTTLDMEALYDDLVALNELAPTLGYPQLPIPFVLDGYTVAAGTGDAMGLAMEFALLLMPAPGLNTFMGYQRPAAWWTLRYKERIYSDGIGEAGGHRTMMANMLAFGLTLQELQAMDDEFEDIAQFIYALEAPCFPEAVDAAAAMRGAGVFEAECSSCHGVYQGPGADYADTMVRTSLVGTDPLRESSWRAQEAAAVNLSWFGQPPMSETDGYLAQPLVGIWARAPYLHNGAVPDLASLLTPSERPQRWRRTGSEASDYDTARLGWRHEVVTAPGDTDTREGRLIIDTTLPGMSNGGHEFGSTLTPAEKSDLLEYLKTL